MTFLTYNSSPGETLISKGRDLISGNTLVINGKNVPLLSGEVQFFRMEPEVWETCLEQVKKLGLPIVSTYLSWRRFSIAPDRYDLDGVTDPRLNVRKFLDLCVKHDLYVAMKPGPWICAEETNGGYPDWLVQNPALQVLDAHDRPVQGYNKPFQSPIPSYFHPDYEKHVAAWMKAVDNAIKDYVIPRGPIILMQLDNEPCFTFHDRMFESDYNPVISKPGGLYSQWLKEKYVSIEQLNSAHGAKFSGFEEIPPPRELQLNAVKEIIPYMDWVEFKENLFAWHVASIGRNHLVNGFEKVLFTINYNLRPQLATPNNWSYLEEASGIGGYDYYPRLPMDVANFIEVVKALNYSRSVNRIAWSPEIVCGIWSFTGQEHGANELQSSDFEYLYLTCLAYGLKGMNFYMLADRDNWVNSPINVNGELTETTNAVSKTVQVMQSVPSFYDLQVEQPVGVLYYRPYAREAYIVNENPAGIDGYIPGQTYRNFDALYTNLIEANFNAGIFDPDVHPENIARFKIILVACGAYMDGKTQQILLDYVKQGGVLVCLPEIPDRDWNELPMPVLKDARAGNTPRADRRWELTRIGGGCLIEMRQADLSGKILGELLGSLSIRSAVTSKDPRVKTTEQSDGSNRLFFIINTADEEIDAELRFADIEEGGLRNVLFPDWPLIVEKHGSAIKLAPRSVKVYWQQPG